MLVDPTFKTFRNTLVFPNTRIGTGLYVISHWNFEMTIEGEWDTYPFFHGSPLYGVCHDYGVTDSPEQFMQRYGEMLLSSPDRFVVSFCKVEKAAQPHWGGWRWEKWGPYIGTQRSVAEYLYDEPDIDYVYTFHVYKELSQNSTAQCEFTP